MLTALTVQAQINTGTYKYADETQLWRLTGNAAGLSLDPTVCDSSANRGIAYFDISHRSGDYHRVQEGNQQNTLQFYTERYQKIGRWLYGYGSFHFDMGRIKQRAWSDVFRSYNSNPYLSGSSIPGKYDIQNFELNASLSTVHLWCIIILQGGRPQPSARPTFARQSGRIPPGPLCNLYRRTAHRRPLHALRPP